MDYAFNGNTGVKNKMIWNDINKCDSQSLSYIKVNKDLYWGSDLPVLNHKENNMFTLSETKLNFKIQERIGDKNLKTLKDLHMVRFLKNFCLLPKTQKIKFIDMCVRSEIDIVIE